MENEEIFDVLNEGNWGQAEQILAKGQPLRLVNTTWEQFEDFMQYMRDRWPTGKPAGFTVEFLPVSKG